jgi:hypothetical protein
MSQSIAMTVSVPLRRDSQSASRHRGVSLSLVLAVVLALSTLRAAPARAQEDTQPPLNVDSIVAALASSDVGARSLAVAALNTLAVSATPASARDALVALLDREVATPLSPATDDDAEVYHEYLVELVDSVIRLDDPRGLRSVALLGIQTSRDAQNFVIKQGLAALPALDEAWTMPNAKSQVIDTWGLLLASSPAWLSADARYQLLKRIAGAVADQPVAVGFVGREQGFVSLMPFLVPPDAFSDDPIVVELMGKALAAVRQQISALSATALMSELDVGSRIFCEGAVNDRLGACTAIQSLIANATNQIIADKPGAHGTLGALQIRAQDALSAGVLSAMEVSFLTEVAAAANSKF